MQSTISKISKLPEAKQKKLATLIEEELKWQEIESGVETELDQLADETISEHEAGETLDGDRAFGVLKEDTIIWFWIGSHSDYDKIISEK